MEMVLGVRIPSQTTVPLERIARAGCLLTLSGVLYCGVREYTADFHRGLDETVVCRQVMKTNCSMDRGYIYGNISKVSSDLQEGELKNVLGQAIAGGQHRMALSDQVESPLNIETVNAVDVSWNLWDMNLTEPVCDLWEPKITESAGDLWNVDIWDFDVPDLPSVDEAEEDTSTEEKIEKKEIAGFSVDSQGYITGVTEDLVLMDGVLAISAEPECVGIRADAFSDIEEDVIEIYIPANIHDIEKGAFDCFPFLMYIEVAEDHPYYYSEYGILYAKNGEEIAYPTGR